MAALLAGEERLHHAGQPAGDAAERVRPPGDEHRDHRHPRVGERVQQLLLDAGKLQLIDVAALAARPASEEAGLVPDDRHDHIGRNGRG